ncbi:MAG: putative transposase [Elusimicrobia bacterium]|nr:MAG: putative transposase [Elusimicrobiota bacterium]
MPRIARNLPSWATLHVISRGNRRQNIFEEVPDWGRFLKSLLTETTSAGIVVIAYCLMPNHFHLLIQASLTVLSSTMHQILTSHAAYMNKKYGRVGHLFGDRFKAYLCDPELGLKPLARYIHLNPVRGGLVQSAEQWAWSSHRDYLDLNSKSPSGRNLLMDRFGGDEATAQIAYQAYMAPGIKPRAPRPGEKVPLGVLAAYVEREGGHKPGILKERSRRRDILGTRMKFIELAIAEGYSVPEIAAFLCLPPSSIYSNRGAL